MSTDRIAALGPVLPRLHSLLEQPLTRESLRAHCTRNHWARLRSADLLPEEFEVRLARGLVLRGSFEPDEVAWHAGMVVLWDRRWDTVTGRSNRMFCEYDTPRAEFEAAFDRALAASAVLGQPSGTGTRRPRYRYSWPTRRHAFWAVEDRLLLLCQSEDPGAGGRSVLVWLGHRSHLRSNPYLPQRLKASEAARRVTP